MAALNTTLNAFWKHRGLVFFLLWYPATFLGGLLYFIPVGLVYLAFGLDRFYNPDPTPEVTLWISVLAAAACAAAMGLSIGTAQWLVLRREFKRISGWIAATVAGYAAIGLLPLFAGFLYPGWPDWAFTLIVNGKPHWLARVVPDWPLAILAPGVMTLTLFGFVLGIAQWLVLRGRVRHAGWWIAISTCGWTLGAVLSNLPNAFLAVSASYDIPVLVTGAGMVWLLQHKIAPSGS